MIYDRSNSDIRRYIRNSDYISDLEKLIINFSEENWNIHKLLLNPNISNDFKQILLSHNNIPYNSIYTKKSKLNWYDLFLNSKYLSDLFIFNYMSNIELKNISLNSSFPKEIYNNFKNNKTNNNLFKRVWSFKFFRNMRLYYQNKKILFNKNKFKNYLEIYIKNNTHLVNWKFISKNYNIDYNFIKLYSNNLIKDEFSQNSSLKIKMISNNLNLINFDLLSGNKFYYDNLRYGEKIKIIQMWYRNIKLKLLLRYNKS